MLVEDCSEEEVLRSLVCRVRAHCDETVKRAHQMQRLSPEIWEGLMWLGLVFAVIRQTIFAAHSLSISPNKKIVDLTTGFDQKRPFLRLLQLLWGTNEAIAQRLACSLRLSKPEPEFGQSLSQTLSQLATRASSTYLGRFTLAPQVRAPVPAFEFHLQSLAEEKVPPESWSLRIGKGPPVW